MAWFFSILLFWMQLPGNLEQAWLFERAVKQSGA
jgi:hypothetical protein